MTFEKLKEKIERVPFQPFELELCDGDAACGPVA